jgi:hypothetical protein
MHTNWSVGTPSTIPVKDLGWWHKVLHLFGWNKGGIEFNRLDNDLWLCFRCECGKLTWKGKVHDYRND